MKRERAATQNGQRSLWVVFALCASGCSPPHLSWSVESNCRKLSESRDLIVSLNQGVQALDVLNKTSTPLSPVPELPVGCAETLLTSRPEPAVIVKGPIRPFAALTRAGLEAVAPRSSCSRAGTGVVFDEQAPDLVLWCADGKTVKRAQVDDYLKLINELEAYFVKYGYSLRDPQPGVKSSGSDFTVENPARPLSSAMKWWGLHDSRPESGEVVWRSTIGGRAAREENPQVCGDAYVKEHGRYECAEFYGDELMGVGYFMTSKGSRDGDGYHAESLFGVDYEVFGMGRKTAFEASAAARSGLLLDPAGPYSTSGKLGSDTATNSDSPSAISIKPIPANIFDQPVVVVRTLIGPVPVMLQVGIRGTVGSQLKASASQTQVNASEQLDLGVRAFVEAFVGWDGLALGAGGDLQLIGVSGVLDSAGHLTRVGSSSICYEWTGGPRLELVTLSGSLYVVLSVFVPWEGAVRKFKWEIVGWDGARFPLASDTAQLPRQCNGVCGTTGSRENLLCDGQCVNSNVDGNCGACGVRCADQGLLCINSSCGGCRKGTSLESINLPRSEMWFSCDGPIPHMSCESLAEPGDPTWSNNYICLGNPKDTTNPGHAGPGAHWQAHGPVSGPHFTCRSVNESRAGWSDNYFCAKTSCSGDDCVQEAYFYEWVVNPSHSDRRSCVEVVEPEAPDLRGRFICRRRR